MPARLKVYESYCQLGRNGCQLTLLCRFVRFHPTAKLVVPLMVIFNWLTSNEMGIVRWLCISTDDHVRYVNCLMDGRKLTGEVVRSARAATPCVLVFVLVCIRMVPLAVIKANVSRIKADEVGSKTHTTETRDDSSSGSAPS
jgi:hypothetical protein